MDFTVRLTQLAKIRNAATPVVSVYLNTRWADEHQRDRVRVFLKNEIRKAREAAAGRGLDEALDWVQAQGEALIQQSRFPDAHGVALFAAQTPELREILPVRIPFQDTFVVSDAPFLRPLATLLDGTPAMLVVFVDSKSARLIPLGPEGAGESITLESEVPGHHRRGGWAQLAQSRYQRHIQDHRGRHFEAVADALTQLADGNGVERIVLAGEPRTIAAFRKHVASRIAERVMGSVTGSRHEPDSAILARAAEIIARLEREEARAAADTTLTEAAKSGQAVAGLEETLEAVSRGAVRRLFLLKGFRELGRTCSACGALQSATRLPCRLCGAETTTTELGEAMIARVIGTGGTVTTLDEHRGLVRVGGLVALLRYPL